MNEADLFTEALNRADPAERAAFLDQTCAGNSELRRRVEELLAGYADTGGPLDEYSVAPAESMATADLPTPIATGEHQPDRTREALARPDPDATSARESASSAVRAARVSMGEGIGTVIAGRSTLVDVRGDRPARARQGPPPRGPRPLERPQEVAVRAGEVSGDRPAAGEEVKRVKPVKGIVNNKRG
jgi:hypothetical protein